MGAGGRTCCREVGGNGPCPYPSSALRIADKSRTSRHGFLISRKYLQILSPTGRVGSSALIPYHTRYWIGRRNPEKLLFHENAGVLLHNLPYSCHNGWIDRLSNFSLRSTLPRNTDTQLSLLCHPYIDLYRYCFVSPLCRLLMGEPVTSTRRPAYGRVFHLYERHFAY